LGVHFSFTDAYTDVEFEETVEEEETEEGKPE
jgi:hypothetical protein